MGIHGVIGQFLLGLDRAQGHTWIELDDDAEGLLLRTGFFHAVSFPLMPALVAPLE